MIKTKILIVEDETIVALDIKSALIHLDCVVTDMVTNYEDTLKSIHRSKPDIVLMDIYLENSKDGIETALEIQKVSNIPVIYLSAFSDDETISRAIETNPIGYLTKPFKKSELKSTIRLGVHKLNQAHQHTIDKECKALGYDYYYNLEYQQLFYINIPVKLSVKENALIKILIEAEGSLVSFERLEYLIWPSETVSQSALRTLIYRTRSKLEYKLIETIPTFGCKLTPLI